MSLLAMLEPWGSLRLQGSCMLQSGKRFSFFSFLKKKKNLANDRKYDCRRRQGHIPSYGD